MNVARDLFHGYSDTNVMYDKVSAAVLPSHVYKLLLD